MDPAFWPLNDRRQAARLSSPSHGIVRARIRPGHDAVVLNLSSRGILLDTARRLLPGTVVDLSLERAQATDVVRARVCRCIVAAVAPNRVRYQAALGLEKTLDWVYLGLSFPNPRVNDTHDLPPRSSTRECADDNS